MRSILPGTLVRLKKGNELGIAIGRGIFGDIVTFYGHRGAKIACRFEISVCRNHSQAKNFKPMRLHMPYGKWTCADGTEVLFNREYCPIWIKSPEGFVSDIVPNVFVPHVKQEFYYQDSTAPYFNQSSHETCVDILREWGVESRDSIHMGLFPWIVATGDTELMSSKINAHLQRVLKNYQNPILSLTA
jgi:hypothetical protein